MRLILLSLTLLLITTSAAEAQRGRMRLNRVSLLTVSEVQDELNLSDEQRESIKALAEKLEERRGEREEAADGPRAAQGEQTRQQLAEILSEEQSTRLGQIMLHALGSRALNTPEFKEQLGITDEQLEQMASTRRERMTEMREEMREIFQDSELDFAARRKQVQELVEDVEDEVLAHLSDEQRAQLTDLKGPPFELSMEAMFRGRGPGRRGRDGDRPQRPARPPLDT